MPDRSRKSRANKLAKSGAGKATRSRAATKSTVEKDPAAVSLGRRGGLKGGKARAEKLSPDERKAIARRAAEVRWSQTDDS